MFPFGKFSFALFTNFQSDFIQLERRAKYGTRRRMCHDRALFGLCPETNQTARVDDRYGGAVC